MGWQPLWPLGCPTAFGRPSGRHSPAPSAVLPDHPLRCIRYLLPRRWHAKRWRDGVLNHAASVGDLDSLRCGVLCSKTLPAELVRVPAMCMSGMHTAAPHTHTPSSRRPMTSSRPYMTRPNFVPMRFTPSEFRLHGGDLPSRSDRSEHIALVLYKQPCTERRMRSSHVCAMRSRACRARRPQQPWDLITPQR